MKIKWIALLGVVLLTAQAAIAETMVLKTQKDRESYAVGVDLAKNLIREGIALYPDKVAKGLRDELSGAKLLMTEGQLRLTLNVFSTKMKKRLARPTPALAAANKKQGVAFLAANKSKPGVVSLPDGLQYKILREGKGRRPADQDTVLLNFRGKLLNGTRFADSYLGGKPIAFKVKETLPGWREALKLMPAGSKWEIFVPSRLAYGGHGAGRYIGPNATLIYELNLVAIK